ncbi:UNC5C-like protein [Octopus bimaculoides]|uniref:Netrin receptor UNC5 n=1 Tax=Octopus bimaculoides TaxID=37653 RepID=A0A0L8GPD0_OCTBM|nr:UNC5C-like protein [Octopus bimaculoides]XP_014779206.1 UNC5C-like protein [Octopus bimaculoides]XP_014779207.1 UNC5C-like protein [Octopus bimaculoides]XP_014779208.1 UNC5C-like protein [Octopus bimaculoides]XP_052823147.1 UNC5C-like protein [Octopus bimaculoides]XP_052823148.1 UNC5C-like protein [Octopus bimaculoides]|eukprot:XP_014779205.1 PREDICTED: UNC5C-like protein [Octopus bimaculoides]
MGGDCQPGTAVISLAVVGTALTLIVIFVIVKCLYRYFKKHSRHSENADLTIYDIRKLSEQRDSVYKCACFTHFPFVHQPSARNLCHHQQQQPQTQITENSTSECSSLQNKNTKLAYINPDFEEVIQGKCIPSNTSNSISCADSCIFTENDSASHSYVQKESNIQNSSMYDPNFLLSAYNAGYPIGNCLKEIYQITERSITKQICNKLVVCVSHLVTDVGDTLILDNMGISLYIPPGAIESGKKQVISLVLNWDLSDNPLMTGDESLVSPLVYCGPHGLKLKQSCQLTFKHCAFNVNELKILKSETELTGHKDWQQIKDKDHSGNNNEQCQNSFNITPNECQVNISSFTLFTAIMTILEDCDDDSLPQSCKWLQLAAFSCPLKSNSSHYQIRIYFLNKTPCALQWAIQNEAKFGGVLCCPEKVFLFDGKKGVGHGKDVIINTIYTSEGWEMIEDTDDESNRIPFLYIWHGKCPYASLCFHRQLSTSKPTKDLSLQFHIFQETLESAGEKLIVQNQAKPNIYDDSEQQCQKHKSPQIKIQVSVDGFKESQDIFDVANHLKCKKIPQELRLKLKLLLDPSCLFDKNWKALASYLKLDSSIRYMEAKDSPTDQLLDILEQKMYSLEAIHHILTDIGRIDAATEIEEFLEQSVEELPQN